MTTWSGPLKTLNTISLFLYHNWALLLQPKSIDCELACSVFFPSWVNHVHHPSKPPLVMVVEMLGHWQSWHRQTLRGHNSYQCQTIYSHSLLLFTTGGGSWAPWGLVINHRSWRLRWYCPCLHRQTKLKAMLKPNWSWYSMRQTLRELTSIKCWGYYWYSIFLFSQLAYEIISPL